MAKFKIREGLTERVNEFLNRSQAMLDLYMHHQFPMLERPELVLAGGTRYLKVQKKQLGGSIDNPRWSFSAWCFIDVTTGDILKPKTWKQPAPHARGNVFADDYGMSCVGPYGPNYMGEKPYCKDYVDGLAKLA